MLQSFANRFTLIHQRSRSLLQALSESDLFRKPRELEGSMAMFSCGEYILRSGAAIEQTCGGITTRLWDDPFEWTLPEQLATTEKVRSYLEEVERSRVSAFQFLRSDDELKKQIPGPKDLRTIFDLLLETVARAEHYQGRASAVFQMFSDKKLPRV